MGDHEAHGLDLEPTPAFDPAPPSAEEIEAGRHLFAQPCDFVGGAPSLEGLPEPTLPEVAFAGRSNVGKSSLLNALTGRKALARTSHTPGRTRELNFFRLGGRLTLVDLPGYGYARASKALVREWNETIRLFLRGRPALARVCLLIDARHGAKPSDREVMKLLDEAAVVYQIVLTKADKLPSDALENRCRGVAEIARAHAAAHPLILPTSARTGRGLPDLRAALAALAESG